VGGNREPLREFRGCQVESLVALGRPSHSSDEWAQLGKLVLEWQWRSSWVADGGSAGWIVLRTTELEKLGSSAQPRLPKAG
jgi:hypothetical protein